MVTSLPFDNHIPQWIFTTVVVAVTTTVAAYLMNKRHFAPIPGTSGPPPEFLIGNFRFFARQTGLWSIWKNVHHHGPFISLWFGPKRFILVSDPDATAEITTNRFAYGMDPVSTDVVARIFPYSMPSITGDVWKNHRKVLSPILGHQRLIFLITKMNSIASVTIKNIKERISNTDEPISVKDDLENIAMDTIGYLAFGRPFSDIASEDLSDLPPIDVSPVRDSIEFLNRACIEEIVFRVLSSSLYNYFGDRKKVRNAKNEITKVVHIIANEYEVNRQKMKENKLDQSEWESFMDRSFIAQVLGSKDGRDFTFEELRGEMGTMFMGGTESIVSTLSHAIKLLSEYPEVQEKLYEEIITVIGKDGIPQYEHLQENVMPYLDKVIKEVLRLNLLVPNIVRCALKEVTIKDMVFPKGTSFWLSIAQMHRDPKYWKDPLVFLPERWNADGIANGGAINSRAYIPFGSGLRVCYGMKLANLELRLFLVQLTRAFFFKELPPHLKDRVGEEQTIELTTVRLANIVALPVPRQ